MYNFLETSEVAAKGSGVVCVRNGSENETYLRSGVSQFMYAKEANVKGKMRRKAELLLLAFVCITGTGFAQQVFNVQNGSKAEFYDNLDTALQRAAAGDTIYLPAGLCNTAASSIIIDKPLAIIGIGGKIDSTSTALPTEFNKPITFTANASGSLLTGCKIANATASIYLGDSSAVQNISLIRNNFTNVNSYLIYIYDSSSNIFIRENTFIYGGGIAARNGSFSNNKVNYIGQCFIENNVFGGVVSVGFLKNSYINNNVFASSVDFSNIAVSIEGYGIQGLVNNSVIQNNYFKLSLAHSGSNNTYNHNAFGEIVNFSGGVNNIGTNNLGNQALGDTFEDGTYIVKSNSPCKNAGTDGRDIGIYGGTFPYKSIPFNPHIGKRIISTQTDGDGNLRIDIKVEAQDR